MVLGQRFWFQITNKKEVLVCFLYTEKDGSFFWNADSKAMIVLNDEQVATLKHDDPDLHTGPQGTWVSSTSY